MMITMDMGSFEIDINDQDIEYDDEITRSGWNPAVDLVLEELEQVTPDDDLEALAMSQPNSHEDVADVISEIVRRKTYSYRH